MLEGQARVPQEGDRQRRPATDASEPCPKRPAQREDVDGAEVRELAVLDVAPNLLDGIQLWSVARQSFDRHPRPLLSEILPHHAARVPTESVPDHDDVAAWEVALEGAQKADQRKIVVTAGPRLEVAAPTPAIPAERERLPIPISAVDSESRERIQLSDAGRDCGTQRQGVSRQAVAGVVPHGLPPLRGRARNNLPRSTT